MRIFLAGTGRTHDQRLASATETTASGAKPSSTTLATGRRRSDRVEGYLSASKIA